MLSYLIFAYILILYQSDKFVKVEYLHVQRQKHDQQLL